MLVRVDELASLVLLGVVILLGNEAVDTIVRIPLVVDVWLCFVQLLLVAIVDAAVLLLVELLEASELLLLAVLLVVHAVVPVVLWLVGMLLSVTVELSVLLVAH